MKTLKNWIPHQQAAHSVELKVEDRHFLRLYVLEEGLMRVLLKRAGQLALNRTWSIAPGKDVPWQGRDREALDGFTLPDFKVEHDAQQLQITTERLRVTVHQPLCLSWEQFDGSDWQRWLPIVIPAPICSTSMATVWNTISVASRRIGCTA